MNMIEFTIEITDNRTITINIKESEIQDFIKLLENNPLVSGWMW